MKLTEEQRKIVEENHSLIYLVIRNMGLLVEEHYDIAAIGLCKAALSYDSEKSSFSTYACRCIRNEILYDFRARKMPKRVISEQLVSYDAPVMSADETEKIALIDCIKAKGSTENEALSKVMYEEVIRNLGDVDSKVLPLFQQGYKQAEIAKIMGVSQANISRVKRRVEKMLACEY